MRKLCGRTALISTLWSLFSLGYLLIGCNTNQQTSPPADSRAADEAAVRKADADWAAKSQSKQTDDWVGFYSDDAVVLPPNQPAATTKESIRNTIGNLLALPGLMFNWQAAKVEVARSGDLAYVQGTYELSFKPPKGKAVSDHGKYVEDWKKQPDGSWKCTVDMWSSDMPATPPAK